MGVPPSPGELIAGKYRVERRLGEGGMGVVLAVTHLVLDKPRAIKLMRSEIAASAEATRRFVREAQAVADLTSEHVARVFDADRLATGEPYIVMEYLEGKDLAAVLDAYGQLPLDEAALYARQACEALAEAHGRGIVHRDVKPANLFLTRRADGAPSIKVLDFGIAKATASARPGPGGQGPPSTAAGAFLGTFEYMSPEQMTSDPDIDARADVWALGVVLYELVTGRRPFESRSAMQLFALVTEAAPAPPSEYLPGLPPAFEAIVLRCLEKDRGARFAGVAELSAALQPFALEGRPPVDRLEHQERARIDGGARTAAATAPPAVRIGLASPEASTVATPAAPPRDLEDPPRPPPAPPASHARRGVWIAAGAAVVVAAATTAILARARVSEPSSVAPPSAPPTSAAPPPSPPPAPSPPPPTSSAPEPRAPLPTAAASATSWRPRSPRAGASVSASSSAAPTSTPPVRAPRAPSYDVNGDPVQP
jgi:serine/threonine-protein kinase